MDDFGADFKCFDVIGIAIACHAGERSQDDAAFCFFAEVFAADVRKVVVKSALKRFVHAVAHAAVFGKIGGCFAGCNEIVGGNAVRDCGGK